MPALSLQTSRLRISWLKLDDAEFIYRLVNDPDWLRYIGDRGVHNLDQARDYLETGPLTMYRRFGFGLNRVALCDSDEAIGICGILQRDNLSQADLGFAFLPEYRRQGYAMEAARAVIEHAAISLAQKQLVAILSPDNRASTGLLTKLGFRYDRPYRATEDAAGLDLYRIDLAQ